jgi:hypothetical protein
MSYTVGLCVSLKGHAAHRLFGRIGTLYGFKCSLIKCGKRSSKPSSEQSFYCVEARKCGGGTGGGRYEEGKDSCTTSILFYFLDVSLKELQIPLVR